MMRKAAKEGGQKESRVSPYETTLCAGGLNSLGTSCPFRLHLLYTLRAIDPLSNSSALW